MKTEKFTEAQITRDTVVFRFVKMSAFDAWDLLEKLREQVGTMDIGNASPKGESDVEVGTALLTDAFKGIMGMDRAFVREIKDELFQYVEFQTKTPDGKAQPFLKMSATPEVIEDVLTPVLIYELMLRAFVVNFTESWCDMTSRFAPVVARLKALIPSKR